MGFMDFSFQDSAQYTHGFAHFKPVFSGFKGVHRYLHVNMQLFYCIELIIRFLYTLEIPIIYFNFKKRYDKMARKGRNILVPDN